MRLDALKVVDKKDKDPLLKEKATTRLLVEKIILLVGTYLLADNKIKKIVQIIQLHQDVSLDKKVKDHLLKEKATILLLVVKAMFLLVVVVEKHLLLNLLVVVVEKHLLLNLLVVAVEKHLLLNLLVVVVEKHLLLNLLVVAVDHLPLLRDE